MNAQSPIPEIEADPIQRAVATFTEQMAQRLKDAEARNTSLQIENGSLVSEVAMLREELRRIDAACANYQSIASSLTGELAAIKDVIDGSFRRAIQAGVESKAKPPAKPIVGHPEKATGATPAPAANGQSEAPETAPAANQGTGMAVLTAVDWSPKT